MGSTGSIIGITVGVIVAVGLVALILWLLSRKKGLKKAAKDGKKYQKQSKLSYLLCRASLKGNCTAPTKGGSQIAPTPTRVSANSAATAAATAAAASANGSRSNVTEIPVDFGTSKKLNLATLLP